MQFRANGLPRLSLIGHWRRWQDSNAPFNNTRTLIQSSTRQMRFLLPSIKCSAVPPSFRLLPSTVSLSELWTAIWLPRARQWSEAGRSCLPACGSEKSRSFYCYSVELTGFRGADYRCSASVAPSVVLSVNDGFQSWHNCLKFTDDIFHDR